MAKSKTAKAQPAKKAAAAKKANPQKRNSNAQEPIRFIGELVIRLEGAVPARELFQASNFSYSFVRQNATVLTLEVDGHYEKLPPDSGNFYIPILDPNEEKTVRVTVSARQDNPNPQLSVSLKYNGKDVYSPAKAVRFSGGDGGFTERVKLPK